jgi:SAM-dependent methyltransferase
MTALPALRPDFERLRSAKNEPRSAERLAAHYAVEVRLARQLAGADREVRSTLYADVYRELFASVEDHPQNRAKTGVRQDRIRAQVAFLGRWLRPGSTYVEIGCGDAVLTKAIAPSVARAVGIDVTPVLVDFAGAPASFAFVKTDGTELGLPSDTADLVYSNQLMEHLHVDDAVAQLREVFRILKPGGRYVCCTPNRLTGPHDISCYFGYDPVGFHMREYDHRALAGLFREVGFSRVAASVAVKGVAMTLPVAVIAPFESLLEALPQRVRARLAVSSMIANMAGVTLVGVK